ncbi:hypothetical protein BD626DRAFT_519848 [Schizophyllum amplum]|uniref:Uncharacterized protein n=1 Tax=Schizophyllum amplum TaxID=97359 RepID=A0A550BUR9_9AGAR|nr:hypothetical protein BD626DRAFT_519827 [Auriculariopsis ampla]TRM56309.1 hypothetical protein BD626DRAFT_519848 [Auriculariopsis ampla]
MIILDLLKKVALSIWTATGRPVAALRGERSATWHPQPQASFTLGPSAVSLRDALGHARLRVQSGSARPSHCHDTHRPRANWRLHGIARAVSSSSMLTLQRSSVALSRVCLVVNVLSLPLWRGPPYMPQVHAPVHRHAGVRLSRNLMKMSDAFAERVHECVVFRICGDIRD